MMPETEQVRKKRADRRTRGYVVQYIINDMFTVLLLDRVGLFSFFLCCSWIATLLMLVPSIRAAGLRPFVRPTRLNKRHMNTHMVALKTTLDNQSTSSRGNQ